MNMNEIPTPRTDSKAWMAGESCDEKDEVVDADFARDLEREAAAWRDVAQQIIDAERYGTREERYAAQEAFDALKSELQP